MEIFSKEMPSSYSLYDLSDFHLGSPACYERGIEKTIKKILKKENRYCIIKGDIIDGIPIGDKRMKAMSLDGGKIVTPQEQADIAIEILRPLAEAGRLLFCTFGNHEATVANIFDPLDYICNALDVRNGKWITIFTHLKDGEPQWRGFFCHGKFQITSAAKDAIQEEANLKAALRKKLQRKFSNVIVASVGHSHKLIVCPPTFYDESLVAATETGVKQITKEPVDQTADVIPFDARWYVNTGSFHKTYGEPGEGIPYSELALFDPVQLGYVVHKIKNHKYKKAIKVTV